MVDDMSYNDDDDDAITNPDFYLLPPAPFSRTFVAKLAVFAFLFCVLGYFLLGCNPVYKEQMSACAEACKPNPVTRISQGECECSTSGGSVALPNGGVGIRPVPKSEYTFADTKKVESPIACCHAPGTFARLETLESTSDTDPTLLWSVPFTVVAPGNYAVSLVWHGFLQNTTSDPGTFVGANITAEVDGNPLPDFLAVNLSDQPGPNYIVSWLVNGTYQSLAPSLTAGVHTLDFYWNVFDSNCLAQTAPGEASVRIERF